MFSNSLRIVGGAPGVPHVYNCAGGRPISVRAGPGPILALVACSLACNLVVESSFVVQFWNLVLHIRNLVLHIRNLVCFL